MSEFNDEPVRYGSIKHNYEHAAKTRRPRFRDDSLAIGGIVAACLVVFLFIVGIIALGVK